MTCKDCLHYEVCEVYSARDTWATQHCAEECVCFADRSEWVHLPDDEYLYNSRRYSKTSYNRKLPSGR